MLEVSRQLGVTVNGCSAIWAFVYANVAAVESRRPVGACMRVSADMQL